MRARSIALLAPCVFFVNVQAGAAPADTAEWRFQQPDQFGKQRVVIPQIFTEGTATEAGDFPGLERRQPQAQLLRAKPKPLQALGSAPPIEAGDFPGLEREQPAAQLLLPKPKPLTQLGSAAPIEAGDFAGLEREQPTPQPFKARLAPRVTIFAPQEVTAAAPFDALEWLYRQEWRPIRRPPAQASTIFGPVHSGVTPFVESSEWAFRIAPQPRVRSRGPETRTFVPPEVQVTVEGLEWAFRVAQLPRLRQRGPSTIVIQPVDVQVVVDGLEWQFKAPQARARRPAQDSAIFGPAIDGAEALEWVFRLPAQRQPAKLPPRVGITPPFELVQPSPDSLEWLFRAPRSWRRDYPLAAMPYLFSPREPWETLTFIQGLKGWNALEEVNAWNARDRLTGWSADTEVSEWGADTELTS